MRSPTEIKRLEREVLRDYIHKLFLSLPIPIRTNIDKVRAKAIWEKIENAEEEHALI
jgi:hypothetical protein